MSNFLKLITGFGIIKMFVLALVVLILGQLLLLIKYLFSNGIIIGSIFLLYLAFLIVIC